jgi:hypothetical protein
MRSFGFFLQSYRKAMSNRSLGDALRLQLLIAMTIEWGRAVGMVPSGWLPQPLLAQGEVPRPRLTWATA